LVDDLDINDEETTAVLKDHNEEHFALILDPETNKLVHKAFGKSNIKFALVRPNKIQR